MSLLVAAVICQIVRTTQFVFVADKPYKKVSLAGTFNNWNKDADPMRVGSDGKTWTLDVKVAPGKHQYKFVLDGETWITDPKAVKNEDDGNGNVNSVLLILPPGYEKPAKVDDGLITTEAVRHLQELPSLNWDRGYLTLTVEARPVDVRTVKVVFQIGGDPNRFDKPVSNPSGDTTNQVQTVTMAERGGDEFVTRFVARVPWNRKQPIRYSFALDDGGRGPLTLDMRGPWYQIEESPGLKDSRFVLDPKSFKPMTPPSWVEKSVVYQIFPDRFANGDNSNDPKDVTPWNGTPTYSNFFGGDFAGVKKHLGYLQDLNIGCVYFNPVFEGPSNHRYEATDYKRVDHRLGTNKEFADLTVDMDKRGIKTVLDGVFNHTAIDFFAFSDILKNQKDSKYLDWYSIKTFPVAVADPPPYEAWFGFKSMPKLNNANPAVRDYLLSVPDFWDKNAKIAGWRLDVANEIPQDYWKLFRDRVKSHGQDKWIVGEIWGDGSPWLKGDQFDSVMNYQFRGSVLGFVAQQKTTPTQFWNSLMRTYDSYGPQVSRNMMNLLSSHDTPRILNECGKNAQLARLAAMVQFVWVGAPCVYYGDELGMEGDRDPDNRRGMEWSMDNPTNPYLTLYKSLTTLRSKSPSLQSGDPQLIAAKDDTGLVVFRRKLDNQWAIVAINRSNTQQTVRLKSTESALQIQSYQNDPTSVGQANKTMKPVNGLVELTVSPFSLSVISNSPSLRSQGRNSHSSTIH